MKTLPVIRGFNKTSEAGVDLFAPSIFLEGCNLRCPFCMNARLVLGGLQSEIDLEIVKDYVKESNSEWVMIGGGEPTCTPLASLKNLLEEIRSWGCKIGLSTNGINTDVLHDILPLVNYVAMDIKSANPSDYEKISIVANPMKHVFQSSNLLKIHKAWSNDFDYEIRTTLYPPFVNLDSIRDIGDIVCKNNKWVLQQFRHNKNMIDPECVNITPYSDKDIERFMEIAKEYCNNVTLRYV